MRLIDADAYKKILDSWLADMNAGENEEENAEGTAIYSCICQLDDAPTIDAMPVVHGKWIHARYTATDHFEIVKCSKCGYESFAAAAHLMMGHYCPNCGAEVQPYNS